MTRLLILAALLTGCAAPDLSHLSETERAVAISALLSRPQPQPYQVQPYMMQSAPVPRAPVQCVTQRIGQFLNTRCY